MCSGSVLHQKYFHGRFRKSVVGELRSLVLLRQVGCENWDRCSFKELCIINLGYQEEEIIWRSG